MGFMGFFKIVDLLIQLIYFEVDFNSNVIFEFPGINLCNIKLILAENNNGLEKFDLQYTKRPKLWRPWFRWQLYFHILSQNTFCQTFRLVVEILPNGTFFSFTNVYKTIAAFHFC